MAAASGQSPAELAAAEAHYEALARREPTADHWQRLGIARYMQNKYEAAIEPLGQAVRLNPKLWSADLFLGISLYRTNRFPQALQSLKRAATLAPIGDRGRDDVDYWLGAAYIAAKQPLPGLMALERLLARNPNHRDALQLAAVTYADASSALWNGVAERHFETAPGYEIHGNALEAEGNFPGALEAYRQSRTLGPGRPGPGAAIGRLLLREGKAEEALATLRNEPTAEAAYYRGLALLQLDRGAEAAPFLEKAAASSPTDPEPAIALAQVYLALGDKPKAEAAARRALALAPDSPAARELLDSALLR